MIQYIIRDEAQLKRLIDGLHKDLKGIEQGKEYIVQVMPARRRSAQNNLIQKWYRVIAADTGGSPDDIASALKVMYWGTRVYKCPFTGKQKQAIPQSSNKSVAEFSAFMDFVEVQAAKLGIRLPKPIDLG